jgi:hypothetical protein
MKIWLIWQTPLYIDNALFEFNLLASFMIFEMIESKKIIFSPHKSTAVALKCRLLKQHESAGSEMKN